jgi:hypothetical protein
MDVGNFIDDEVNCFVEFLVGTWVLIAKDNGSPFGVESSLR